MFGCEDEHEKYTTKFDMMQALTEATDRFDRSCYKDWDQFLEEACDYLWDEYSNNGFLTEEDWDIALQEHED